MYSLSIVGVYSIADEIPTDSHPPPPGAPAPNHPTPGSPAETDTETDVDNYELAGPVEEVYENSHVAERFVILNYI